MSVNFLELFNAVARLARPAHVAYIPLPQMNTSFSPQLDSLEMLMCNIYICEIYGIPEEIGKTINPPTTPQEMLDGVTPHIMRQPESVESALGMIR